MAVEPMRVGDLRPYARKARTHSKKQVKQIARSINRFGFTNPVLSRRPWEWGAVGPSSRRHKRITH